MQEIFGHFWKSGNQCSKTSKYQAKLARFFMIRTTFKLKEIRRPAGGLNHNKPGERII